MKIDPNAPAMPTPDTPEQYKGLTIRAELAARFMGAMISGNCSKNISEAIDARPLAKAALESADALIAELNK